MGTSSIWREACPKTHQVLVLQHQALLYCFVNSMYNADHHCHDIVSRCCCDSDAFGVGRATCSSEAFCGVMACLSTSPAWKVQLPCTLFALVHSVAHPLHKLYQGLHCACNVSVCTGQQKLCQGIHPTSTHHLCLLALAMSRYA